MEKLVLTIPTLYGDHHTVAVRRILDGIAGVSDPLVSAAYRQVALKFDPAKTSAAAIEKALAAQGYDPGLDDLAYPIQSTFAEEATRHTASISGTGTSLAFAEVTQVVQGRPLWPCPGFDPRTPHPPD
jgi:copper chaperone CopZ